MHAPVDVDEKTTHPGALQDRFYIDSVSYDDPCALPAAAERHDGTLGKWPINLTVRHSRPGEFVMSHPDPGLRPVH
jgi:hypothetical protein